MYWHPFLFLRTMAPQSLYCSRNFFQERGYPGHLLLLQPSRNFVRELHIIILQSYLLLSSLLLLFSSLLFSFFKTSMRSKRPTRLYQLAYPTGLCSLVNCYTMCRLGFKESSSTRLFLHSYILLWSAHSRVWLVGFRFRSIGQVFRLCDTRDGTLGMQF